MSHRVYPALKSLAIPLPPTAMLAACGELAASSEHPGVLTSLRRPCGDFDPVMCLCSVQRSGPSPETHAPAVTLLYPQCLFLCHYMHSHTHTHTQHFAYEDICLAATNPDPNFNPRSNPAITTLTKHTVFFFSCPCRIYTPNQVGTKHTGKD